MKVIRRLLLLITIVMFPIVVNAKESVLITKIEEVDSHYDFTNMKKEDRANYQNELLTCYDGTNSEEVFPTSVIKDKSEGCYTWPIE